MNQIVQRDVKCLDIIDYYYVSKNKIKGERKEKMEHGKRLGCYFDSLLLKGILRKRRRRTTTSSRKKTMVTYWIEHKLLLIFLNRQELDKLSTL